ncbi:MAG: C1 family peptidase [Deltaproteobacteria bacterium]|nr:C1 family peptidase [Deltaproteobacteria bacterium]
MAMVGCSSSDPEPQLPALPEGATRIADDVYADLESQGKIIEIAASDEEDQAAALETLLEEDTKTLQDFMTATGIDPSPGAPNEDQESVVLLPGGAVRHAINLNDGTTSEVVNLSERDAIHSIAQGIRVFPTRANQIEIYRALYDAAPPSLRQELELPEPDVVSNIAYTVEDIRSLNARLVSFHDGIIAGIEVTPGIILPSQFDCSEDLGTGTGGDRYADDGQCGFQAGGIFANHDFNHKSKLTCVKNQAGRGTCCAFAVASATEHWVNRRLNARVNLSEQALYNRMKFNWLRDDRHDGYYISDALDYAIAEGYLLPFENQWNYNPSLIRDELEGGGFLRSCNGYTETCSNSSHQSAVVCNSTNACAYEVPEKNPDFLGIRLKAGHVLWDRNDKEISFLRILIYLALGDPVLIQVPVLDQFDAAAETGYVHYVAGDVDIPAINQKSTNRGNHIMHAVGYLDNDKLRELLPDAPLGSGGGYIIVKNSWGTCWGDGGYVYLPYDYLREYTQYASVLTAIHEN